MFRLFRTVILMTLTSRFNVCRPHSARQTSTTNTNKHANTRLLSRLETKRLNEVNGDVWHALVHTRSRGEAKQRCEVEF